MQYMVHVRKRKRSAHGALKQASQQCYSALGMHHWESTQSPTCCSGQISILIWTLTPCLSLRPACWVLAGCWHWQASGGPKGSNPQPNADHMPISLSLCVSDMGHRPQWRDRFNNSSYDSPGALANRCRVSRLEQVRRGFAVPPLPFENRSPRSRLTVVRGPTMTLVAQHMKPKLQSKPIARALWAVVIPT